MRNFTKYLRGGATKTIQDTDRAVSFPPDEGSADYREFLELVGQGQANVTEVVWPVEQAGPVCILRQTAFAEVVEDTTTQSEEFVDLLALTLTTLAGNLLINASMAASNTAADSEIIFRVTVDGNPIKNTKVDVKTAGKGSSASIVARPTVAAGEHTVKLRWKVSAASTGRIRPVGTDKEGCSLSVMEME